MVIAPPEDDSYPRCYPDTSPRVPPTGDRVLILVFKRYVEKTIEPISTLNANMMQI